MARKPWEAFSAPPPVGPALAAQRARRAAYDAQRAAIRIAEHRCKRCWEVMEPEYTKITCAACRSELSSRIIGRKGRGKYD